MALDPVKNAMMRRSTGMFWVRRTIFATLLYGILTWPATADVSPGEALAFACGGCHGHTGVSAAATMPSIAGFDRRYLARVLREYKTGVRTSTIMGRLMEGYSMQEIALLAAYYSEQQWDPTAANANVKSSSPELIAQGATVHTSLCEQCHENEARYQDRDMPRLAGQQPEYLLMQLKIRREGGEGVQQPRRMREALAGLTDANLLALSRYFASID